MTLRYTLCNEVVGGLPFANQCALAAGLGYEGLEVAPFTLDAEAPHLLPDSLRGMLRATAQEEGVAITGLHWLLLAPKGLSITSGETAVRARTLDFMQRLIALCADLGGRYLVHGSPYQRAVEADGDAARAEEAMALAGAWAADAGVTYCLEPLAGEQTNWATTIAEAAAITSRIGNPHLRTMIDTCAAGLGESDSAAALIEHWMPRGVLAHVHLNDRNRRAPGQGEDRFGPILRALRATGYEGLCGLEPFEYVPDGPTSAARTIGYLRGIEEALG
ncbi:MAG TPA: sugar phosphate isomerase/epimerase family protein [Roseomonas sp.]|jgi:sugar phosphate isomerase/epimerase